MLLKLFYILLNFYFYNSSPYRILEEKTKELDKGNSEED